MKRIVCVGNGPSLRGSGLGPAIDACDEVVRFTLFVNGGEYAKDVGTRTTIWSTYIAKRRHLPDLHTIIAPMYGMRSEHVLEPRWRQLCAWYEPEGVRMLRLPHYILCHVCDAMGLNANNLIGKKPTAGLSVVRYVIDLYPEYKVLVCGYDGYQLDKPTHYYSSGIVSPGELRKVDVQAERAYFKSLVDSGRVEVLL